MLHILVKMSKLHCIMKEYTNHIFDSSITYIAKVLSAMSTILGKNIGKLQLLFD